MCDHHVLDLETKSCANSLFNVSHVYITCIFFIYSYYIYHSFNSDICILPMLPHCDCIWICFWVALNAKSNLYGMHINRQIQIMESLHAHTTQIYTDDKIWCGWHCLWWKIIGMSQHVSSIIMNDVRKRKVTAEDRGIM